MTIPVPRGKLCVHVISTKLTTPGIQQSAAILQVSSHDVLQNGTLSARLRSHDDNLGQIYGVLDLRPGISIWSSRIRTLAPARGPTYSYGGKDILQFIDKCDEPRVVHVDTGRKGVVSISRG